MRRKAVALLLALIAVSCAAPAEPRPSIVVIVVDALRPDHLGAYGYERPTSPEIDDWAAGAAVYDHAFSTAPWTLPAFGSLYTGRLPSRHAAGAEVAQVADLPSPERLQDVVQHVERKFLRLDEGLPTLPELLAEAGYFTGAFVNNPFLKPEFRLDRGFMTYELAPASVEYVLPADVTIDRALGWIDERGGGPFFLLLHLMEPHLLYQAPEPFFGRFSGPARQELADSTGLGDDSPEGRELTIDDFFALRERIHAGGPDAAAAAALQTALYDEEIAFVDQQIGRLLDGLRSRRLLDGSVVVLTADHGEEFFEHGGFEHGHTLYNELLRVPLIVSGPRVRPGHRPDPVSLVDVMPTLLESAGVPPPAELEGVSLHASLLTGEPLPRRPLLAERPLYGGDGEAIVRWPFKAIFDLDGGAAQLFDLERDPLETDDLADRESALLSELLGELQQTLAGLASEASAEGVELDRETIERLRALGYIR